MPTRLNVITSRRIGAECAVKLNKRRHWFDDEGNTQEPATPQATPDDSTTQRTPIEPATPVEYKLDELPEHWQIHVKELRAESRSRRLALREEQDAQKIRAQEALEQQGEYKKLAAELTQELQELRPIKDKYMTRIAYDESSNEERINAIPEQLRSVIPTDYAADKLAQWLDTNASKLALPAVPDIDAGAGGASSRAKPVTLTPEQKNMAKMFNMTDEEYVAQLPK